MIIFHNEIKKGMSARDILVKFLDKTEPELIRWLHHTWNTQGRAITYKELREAIMSGIISQEWLEDWQQDYSRLVTTCIAPLYAKAMQAATEQLRMKHPTFSFDPMTEGVKHWTDTMGASFVTNSTTEQIQSVRWAVARASQLQDLGVDELARVIRPMVGLNRPQTIANMNYYKRLREQGISEAKARDLSIRYSARQHRYRGHMIARTELAFAYNKGEHEGVAQAIERGYMGRVVKIWETAGDDRVCDRCRELERRSKRQPVDFDAGFNFPTRLKVSQPDIDVCPPAHPHCLLPGNKVIAPDIIGGTVRRFEGTAVTIRTASGHQITCTPNHPILTDRGWIGAGELKEGDKVVEATDIDSVMLSLEADNYNMPTPIEEIANSFLMAEGVTTRTVPVSAEDFHGDGTDGEVCVVYTDSLLGNNLESTGADRDTIVGQNQIDGTPVNSQTLMQRKAGITSNIGRDHIIPDSGMLTAEDSLGMSWGVIDPVTSEPTIDGTFIDAELFRNLLDGESSIIELTSIVEIKREFVNSHVYNLQTKKSVYFADGIITHNCRCAIVYKEITAPTFTTV